MAKAKIHPEQLARLYLQSVYNAIVSGIQHLFYIKTELLFPLWLPAFYTTHNAIRLPPDSGASRI